MLKKLVGLNFNNNQIDEVESKELPPSLQLISFKNNPVALVNKY